jgi:hypothetical protein
MELLANFFVLIHALTHLFCHVWFMGALTQHTATFNAEKIVKEARRGAGPTL